MSFLVKVIIYYFDFINIYRQSNNIALHFFRFVYEDNIHDGYWLKMGIGKSDPLKDKRIELLKKLNLLPNSEYFVDRSSEPVDGQLVSFLRVFNMTDGEY